MTTIVTRITGATAKNAPMTNAELDNNFINLNTDKVEASADIVTLSGLGALKVPSGTTGEQPTPVAGMIRYNVTTGLFEAYRSSSWTTIDNATSTNTINTIVKRDAVGNFAAGNITGENMTLNGTSAIKVPSGTTGQQPLVPSNGMLRYNVDTSSFEGYQNGVWAAIAGGGGGSGMPVQSVFYENNYTLTEDYTLPQLKNAMAVGPLNTQAGVTMLVSSGSRLIIL